LLIEQNLIVVTLLSRSCWIELAVGRATSRWPQTRDVLCFLTIWLTCINVIVNITLAQYHEYLTCMVWEIVGYRQGRFSQPLRFTACNRAIFSERGWDNPSK
jgi:hypothetical protein